MRTRFLIFAAMWFAWLLPFMRKVAGPREKAVVKDKSARWGIILVAVAFSLVFSIQDAYVPDWRIALAIPFGLIGILTTWLAVRSLDKQWRLDAALNEDHDLVRTGPYAVVRHPIYAAMFAMLLAAGCLFTHWPVLIVAIVIFVLGTEIRIRAEDNLLRSRFHAEFDAYARSVSAYLPFLR
jgi:protein-S-isoprenylcysteine O-methyltransferase Ste14